MMNTAVDVRRVGLCRLRVAGLAALRVGLGVVGAGYDHARTMVPATGLCHRW